MWAVMPRHTARDKDKGTALGSERAPPSRCGLVHLDCHQPPAGTGTFHQKSAGCELALAIFLYSFFLLRKSR
jgi:hypothetical protein